MNIDPATIKAALAAMASGDPEAIAAALTALLTALAGGQDPAADPGAEALAEDPAVKPGDPTEPPDPKAAATLAAAVASTLMQLTGANSAGAAVEIIRGLKTRVDSIDADRAVLELSERCGLIADLVKLGSEVPATAWLPEEAGKPRVPAKRLAEEPIAELRSRVATLKASGVSAHRGHAPPAGGSDVTTLSASEIAAAKARNMTPEQFTEAKKNAVRRA